MAADPDDTHLTADDLDHPLDPGRPVDVTSYKAAPAHNHARFRNNDGPWSPCPADCPQATSDDVMRAIAEALDVLVPAHLLRERMEQVAGSLQDRQVKAIVEASHHPATSRKFDRLVGRAAAYGSAHELVLAALNNPDGKVTP